MADHSGKTMFFSSPIDVDMWNRARWKGVAYLHYPEGDVPPIMALMFENKQAGHDIFTLWRTMYGPKDTKDVLRISIVEGDAKGWEPGYFVHIGFDPDRVLERAQEQGIGKPDDVVLTMVSRIHRMNPPADSPNLPRFKADFAKHRKYGLAPAFMTSKGLEPDFNLVIEKTKIEFRRIEDIGENDLDRLCLDSKPVE